MAEWTTAEVNDLPDSAFLTVEAGGSKDDQGKTTPRSLRHFPVRGPDGKLDLPHLRNAIARIPQSDLPADKKRSLQEHAQKLLEADSAKSDRADAEGRVQRFDLASGKVEGYRQTPQGGLIVRGNLTRTGVLTYRNPDGSERRELRHPDDVFHPDSLASLSQAPVTVDHPDEVTPANWKAVAVGHVAGTPHKSGSFVASDDVRLHDAKAIDMAKRGDLQEFSCGYSCRIDATPGSYDGQPFDARQTHIRYNHVAAGPQGWGRAGSEVRLRLDARFAVSGASGSYVRDNMADENNKLDEAQKALTKATTDLEKARADAKDAKTEADKASARTREVEAENAKLRAENEVFKLQASRTDSVKSAREQQARHDADVASTVSAVRLAERIIGSEYKSDGKKAAEIKRDVLAHLEPELGKDNPELAPAKLEGAALDVALDQAVRHADSASASRQSVQGATVPHRDAARGMPGAVDDDPDADKDDAVKKARDSMIARNKDAWKTGKKWDRSRAASAAQRSK